MSARRKSAGPGAAATPGVIDPEALYTVEEVMARLGIGEGTLRNARRPDRRRPRKGEDADSRKDEPQLRILHWGKRRFILGSELIEHIKATAREAIDC